MEFIDKLSAAIVEENTDARKYEDWAGEADMVGLTDVANTLRNIAKDESRHRSLLRGMLVELSEPDTIVLSGKMMEVPLGGGENHYWEVTNMITGGILFTHTPYRTIAEAVNEAQYEMDTNYKKQFGDNHLVIKIFDKSPIERSGVTFEPEYTESYWIEGAAKKAIGILDSISKPLTLKKSSLPFPQTYGDWVELGVSIKEKVGIGDFETTTAVNNHLNSIYYSSPGTEESKRWLMQKAGELGIK